MLSGRRARRARITALLLCALTGRGGTLLPAAAVAVALLQPASGAASPTAGGPIAPLTSAPVEQGALGHRGPASGPLLARPGDGRRCSRSVGPDRHGR
jgi:hypothetical protein